MSFNTHNIYHPLIVNSGWTSQSVSATTISAGTFYGGSLSATYVGNQNVTDQEFKYLSGVTSNIQTQINNLVNRTERLLTFQSDDFLTNDRVISSGNNINFESTNSHLGISASFPSVEVSAITVTLTSVQSAITNFNPTNWESNVNNRSTQIIFTGNQNSIISGLYGGQNGRIAVLTNLSNGLIILEHNSTATTIGNQFYFNSNLAYFLVKNRTISLIYDDLFGWRNIDDISEDKGFNEFSDFFVRPNLIPRFSTWGNLGPFAIQISNGTITSTGFSNSEGVTSVSVNNPATPLIFPNSVTIRPGRNFLPYSQSCGVAKIRINKETGFGIYQNSINLSFKSDFKNSNANQYILQDTSPKWVTPITSATVTNTTNWYCAYYSTNSVANIVPLVSSIPLSYTVNNWIYLGIYVNTIGQVWFFHSFDGSHYIWDFYVSSAVGYEKSGLNLSVSTLTPGHEPKLFVDWLGNQGS
jgi:hypothetical protein